jgi:hypothetical protein
MPESQSPLKFTKLATGTDLDAWTFVSKGSPVGVWEKLGYVAKLDAIQSHGNRRAKAKIRSNSCWVASLTAKSTELLPEEGYDCGVGKYQTRREAAERLLVASQ